MTNVIVAEEAANTTEAPAKEEHTEEAHPEGEHPEGEEPQQEGEGDDFANEQPPQGNILDEAGKEDMKELGFDTKEFLTNEEMRTLYNKVFFKSEITDPQEKEFYAKLIDKVMKEMPEKVPQAEVRNFFDIPFLMKHVEQEPQDMDNAEAPEVAPEATKDEM